MNAERTKHIGGRKMKPNSNLFSNTRSAKEMAALKERNRAIKTKKRTRSLLSKKEQLLVKEVKDRGGKITEKDVVFIVKGKDGKIIWLEKGKSKSPKPSGLKHIIEKQAVEEAKIVGISGVDRPVYETTFDKKVVHLAITISDNGYIVGVHLTNKWKEIKSK